MDNGLELPVLVRRVRDVAKRTILTRLDWPPTAIGYARGRRIIVPLRGPGNLKPTEKLLAARALFLREQVEAVVFAAIVRCVDRADPPMPLTGDALVVSGQCRDWGYSVEIRLAFNILRRGIKFVPPEFARDSRRGDMILTPVPFPWLPESPGGRG